MAEIKPAEISAILRKQVEGFESGATLEEVGTVLQANGGNGEPVPVRVKEILEEFVVIDGNHPLADMDLSFEIEVLEVQ